MWNTSGHVRLSLFRRRGLIWLLLGIFVWALLPSVSGAQQPTTTIKTVNGEVLVSGQTAVVGTILHTGDTIQTQAGASVILTLSDGSEIHLGESTQVTMADLTQTTTGARISRLTLLRGWLRATLSARHQKNESSFTIDTPNAQVGVKFSHPDVEVSYNPAKQETIGIAHTVELTVRNLFTDEEILVPIGSTVIIVGTTIKIVAGILTLTAASEMATAGTGAAVTESSSATAASTATTAGATGGMGTGTMVAIGAGIAAAAGGVAAIAVSGRGYDDMAECSQTHTPTNCMVCVGQYTVRAGRSYWIYGGWPRNTPEEAAEELPYMTLSVTLNGVTLPRDGDKSVVYRYGQWEVASYHCTGPLASGDYTIQGTWYDSRTGGSAPQRPGTIRAR